MNKPEFIRCSKCNESLKPTGMVNSTIPKQYHLKCSGCNKEFWCFLMEVENQNRFDYRIVSDIEDFGEIYGDFEIIKKTATDIWNNPKQFYLLNEDLPEIWVDTPDMGKVSLKNFVLVQNLK